MSGKLTALSAGYAICGALQNALKDKVTAIYPVYSTSEDAKVPYIVYFREGVQLQSDKSEDNRDTCNIVVQVYDTDYDRGLELIEEARAAIEKQKIIWSDDDDPSKRLVVNCTKVTDSAEDWDMGLYLQQITIGCKIS